MVEIMIKIGATLAALFLIWLCRHLLVIAFSAAQAQWGKGHNVSGSWTARYTKRETAPNEEHAELKQVLHWVSGTIKNSHVKRTYRLHGTVTANILLATYDLDRDAKDSSQKHGHRAIDCGAFTLLIEPGGERMHGRYCWMDDQTGGPESGDYDWQRS